MSYPYDEHLRPVKPPLTAAARVMRGFRRIGLVLALPTFVLGLALTTIYSWNESQRVYDTAVQMNCIARRVIAGQELLTRAYSEGAIDPGQNGCPGPSFYLSGYQIPRALQTLPDARPIFLANFGIWAGVTVFVSLLIFVIPYALGWILAGFTRD